MISLFSASLFNIGAVVFAFALLNLLFIPYIKVAIINMLFANILFAAAMAFPQKILAYLGEESFLVSLISGSFYKAVVIGGILYIILFLLLCKIFRLKAKEKAAQNKAEEHKAGEDHGHKTVRADKEHIMADKVSLTADLKAKDNNTADPRLFDNVLKKKEDFSKME